MILREVFAVMMGEGGWGSLLAQRSEARHAAGYCTVPLNDAAYGAQNSPPPLELPRPPHVSRAEAGEP